MDISMLFGAIPAVLLVVLAGLLVEYSRARAISGRRMLFFLLVVEDVLLLVACIATLPSLRENNGLIQVSATLLPVTVGVLSLILLNLKALKPTQSLPGLSRGQITTYLLSGVIFVGLQVVVFLQPVQLAHFILPSAVVLAGVWILAGRTERWTVLLSLAALASLPLLNSNSFIPGFQTLPTWVSVPVGILLFILPGLVVVLASVLFYTSLRSIVEPVIENQPSRSWSTWLRIGLKLALALLLLGCLAYTIFWASIWDQTSDGMSGLMFLLIAGLLAITTGMILIAKAKGWLKSTGIAYAILVPLAMIGAARYGWSVPYHSITEDRALRIQSALEAYHTRSGRYPAALGELVPRDLVWIPVPVLLRGEDWCYQGGAEYYRLGSFYREYFSGPLSLHVYASAGNPPAEGWTCQERLAEMKARYDPIPFDEMDQVSIPTAQPQPTSVVSMPKTPLQLLLKSRFVNVGHWSPGGEYLPLAVSESGSGQKQYVLSFLNAQTGEMCRAGMTFPEAVELREHQAWLPDGRLLFLSADKKLFLFRPCQPEVEDITDRYKIAFDQIVSTDSSHRHILLKNQVGFWIFNANTQEIQPVAGVTPNPYQAHWDNAAWSPDGKHLAISRLNSRDKTGGSTLFIVTSDSGEVMQSLPLKDASDQSAPWVEWLTQHELLLNGSNTLAIIDIQTTPLKITDVMKDIFALSIAYPVEVSTEASVPDASGERYHLALRVNHPRNQAVYLYHSETGAVEVLQPRANLLLFFPDGEMVNLVKPGFAVPEQDEYEIHWVDSPEKADSQLVVEGHSPRNYPTLMPVYLPGLPGLAFSSSQGVSLVSLPDGKLLSFWQFVDLVYCPQPWLLPSPGGNNLVITADWDGLYFIPLHPQ